MENKVKKVKVDYAAIIREFEMYGRGRSLKQFCEESNYTYFMDMNDEMKLRLAYAEIASLNEKISKLTAMLEKSAISETEAKWLASVTTWQNK